MDKFFLSFRFVSIQSIKRQGKWEKGENKSGALPLVQPNFSDTSSIMQNNLRHSARECVRTFITENVPNVTTRYYL